MDSPNLQMQDFIQSYYSSVDTEGAHDTYAGCFAADATLTAPDGSQISGRETLRRLHQSLWGGPISRRRHTPDRTFRSNAHDNELVIIGSVEYWGQDGVYTKKNLASHFQFCKFEAWDSLQIQTLKVWLS